MKDLVNILGSDSIEIIFKDRIPHLCVGLTNDYGVINEVSIGDHNITGYNKNNESNLEQKTLNKIKEAIINIILENERYYENKI